MYVHVYMLGCKTYVYEYTCKCIYVYTSIYACKYACKYACRYNVFSMYIIIISGFIVHVYYV